jgi:hypothetical protein
MKDKSLDDLKEAGLRFNSNKLDHDLYHEEDDIEHISFRVKRSPSDKGDNWTIFKNNKVILYIDSSKLNKKENSFLMSKGCMFLLNKAKQGVKSLARLKREINRELENK